MSKSILEAFLFNGDQEKYELFWDSHVNDLRSAGISYILSESHLQLLRKEVPAPAYPRIGSKQARKAQWDLLLCKFRDQCSRREADLKKIEPDFDRAIALLINRLTEDIRPTIKHVLLATDASNEKKYGDARKLILSRYGPNNQNDVEKIKARLKAGSDQHGYLRLFNLHDDCVLQLSMIPKRDLLGNPLLDHEGNIITNKPDSQELRAIFLLQLAKHNKHFESLAIEACAHPDTHTYEYLRDYITNVVKSNAEKYDPASLQPLPNSSSPAQPVAFIAKAAPADCLNCKSDSHRTGDCPSTTCGAPGCGLKFSSVRERKSHWWDTHSQNRRGPDVRTKAGRSYAAQETRPVSMQSSQHQDERRFWSERRERSRSRDRAQRGESHPKRIERSRSRERTRDYSSQHPTPRPVQSEKHVKFQQQSNHAYLDSVLDKVPEDQIREWIDRKHRQSFRSPSVSTEGSC